MTFGTIVKLYWWLLYFDIKLSFYKFKSEPRENEIIAIFILETFELKNSRSNSKIGIKFKVFKRVVLDTIKSKFDFVIMVIIKKIILAVLYHIQTKASNTGAFTLLPLTLVHERAKYKAPKSKNEERFVLFSSASTNLYIRKGERI